MDSTFLNKVAAAILLSVGSAWLASVVGGAVVPTIMPAKPAMSVPGLERVAIQPYMAHADAARGAVLVQAICGSCHALQPQATQSVGPVLGGVAGRSIGSDPQYAYSPALVALRAQVWSDQNLSDWLTAPARFAPGTRMSLMGLPNVAQRADIIAYLHTLNPSPLPSQSLEKSKP